MAARSRPSGIGQTKGPIKFDTDVASGETLTVNIADNTNVTFDNDGDLAR
jgi:hypothetical protein